MNLFTKILLPVAVAATASSGALAQGVYIWAGGGYSLGAGKASGGWKIPAYNESVVSESATTNAQGSTSSTQTKSSSSTTKTNAPYSLGSGINGGVIDYQDK
jgi:hypothetical protein